MTREQVIKDAMDSFIDGDDDTTQDMPIIRRHEILGTYNVYRYGKPDPVLDDLDKAYRNDPEPARLALVDEAVAAGHRAKIAADRLDLVLYLMARCEYEAAMRVYRVLYVSHDVNFKSPHFTKFFDGGLMKLVASLPRIVYRAIIQACRQARAGM